MNLIVVSLRTQPKSRLAVQKHLEKYGIEPIIVDGVEGENKTRAIMLAMRNAALRASELEDAIVMQDDVRFAERPAPGGFVLFAAPYARRGHFCPLAWTAPASTMTAIAEAWNTQHPGSACHHWRQIAQTAEIRSIAYPGAPAGASRH